MSKKDVKLSECTLISEDGATQVYSTPGTGAVQVTTEYYGANAQAGSLDDKGQFVADPKVTVTIRP